MEGQKTSLAMRSGPGVAFVPGMVLSWARWCDGNEFEADDKDRVPFTAKQVGRFFTRHTGIAEKACWEHGCYDILSTPTQHTAPAHVCKGRPCGELIGGKRYVVGLGFMYFNVPNGSPCGEGRIFCSQSCRDAWKPAAKAAPSYAGSGKFLEDTQPPAPPSPAPWKCKHEGCDATISATRGLCIEHEMKLGKARKACGFVDFDVRDAAMRPVAISRLAPWLILPGSIPARRPATDGLPAGASSVSDSIWGDS